jgi:hypothetical protein
MKTHGVCYDAGVVMGVPWRPELDTRTARREMEIIRRDGEVMPRVDRGGRPPLL